MRQTLRIVMLFISFLWAFVAVAQDNGAIVRISGTVTDDKNVTLPGVTVNVKGTQINVVTNIDGKYSLNVPSGSKTLVFSFVGMQTQEVAINGRTVIDLAMSSGTTALSEVVVVGYGTAKRSDVTSSISSISAKDIKDLPVAGIDQALQGKVAGVTVNTNGGAPGGGVSVRIRGITSVGAGGNEPLYVVDGVPLGGTRSSIAHDQLGGNAGQTSNSALASLNPADIESIDILKDASAQAIYGSRAANGVVLITTKKGKAGEGKVQYDVYYGRAYRPKKIDLMDLSQFAQYSNEVLQEVATVNGNAYFPIGEYQNPSILGKGTDWQDAIFQTGITQNHQLAFSGGSDKTTYYTSLNYYDQSGTVIGSGLNRYNLHFNLDQQVKPWLKFGINANLSRSNQRITLTNGSDAIVSVAAFNSPAAPIYNGDGFAGVISVGGYNFGNVNNPVAKARLRDVRNIQSQAFANIYGDILFSKNFTFHADASFSANQQQNSAFQPYVDSPDGQIIMSPSKLVEQRGTGLFWRLVQYFNYNQTFGAHSVTAQVGHEAQLSNYDDLTGSRQNLALNYPILKAGEQANQFLDQSKYVNALDSYFARVGYTFKDKYSLNASIRRDGSSTFGFNNKYGYFPAASVGWTITNEEFAKNIKNVDYLKLRIGAGAVGNQNAGSNNPYTTNITLISTSPFGGIAGFPYNVGNPLLQWESIKTYNAGIDAAFFNRRLEVTVDVYKKRTTKMILAAQLPAYTGLAQNTYDPIQPPTVNAGDMTNTGVDVSINSYNTRTSDFTWQTTLVFSHYKNVLNQLNASNAAYYGYQEYGNAVIVTKTAPGQPVGQFYGFVTDGLFRSQAELDAATINGQIQGVPNAGAKGVYIGDIRYKDFNGDGKLDQNDMRYLGNPNPKFTYGLTNKFTYKGIDLSVFLQGSYGAKIVNYLKRSLETPRNPYFNQLASVLTDRYSATNPDGTLPRYNEWNQNNLLMSDRFIESGSYLRIQNVTLGYNLPSTLVRKAKLTAARIYFSGQNIYTFTKYSGYDPELGSFNGGFSLTNVDSGNYPNPRTFTIGANLTF